MPSITGLPASGPMLPRPSTAVPLVTTATRLPRAVYSQASSGDRRDLQAGLGDAGRIRERQVALGDQRLGRDDLDLPGPAQRGGTRARRYVGSFPRNSNIFSVERGRRACSTASRASPAWSSLNSTDNGSNGMKRASVRPMICGTFALRSVEPHDPRPGDQLARTSSRTPLRRRRSNRRTRQDERDDDHRSDAASGPSARISTRPQTTMATMREMMPSMMKLRNRAPRPAVGRDSGWSSRRPASSSALGRCVGVLDAHDCQRTPVRGRARPDRASRGALGRSARSLARLRAHDVLVGHRRLGRDLVSPSVRSGFVWRSPMRTSKCRCGGDTFTPVRPSSPITWPAITCSRSATL